MLIIVGKQDVPLYEANLGLIKKPVQHLHHFIVHAAIDIVEETTFTTAMMYLKNVDKHSDFLVYAYLTSGNIKFLLLTDGPKNDDSIKGFFSDVQEAYAKNLLNPLYDVNTPITSAFFDMRVRTISSKYF
mmetsp:Transcript_48773/g.56222  ORF Transcript_48773/g.56222 Transcript_48773/m.56222 type:complete len:130 (+) Transcript_48773:25-414(+)